MCSHVFVRTHRVSAVQLLQKGVVCAFGEAALLIDKSQHAQFLNKRQTRRAERVKHTAVTSYNPIGARLETSIRTMHPGKQCSKSFSSHQF